MKYPFQVIIAWRKSSIIHELLLCSFLMCYNLDLNLKEKI